MLSESLLTLIKKYYKLTIVLVLVFTIGVYLGQNVTVTFNGLPKFEFVKKPVLSQSIQSKDVPTNVNLDFSLFWKVWDRISTDYIDKSKADPQKLYYGAIKGMVAALGDPYTSFLDPQQNQDFNTQLSGTFEGVGLQLGVKDNRLVVMSPIDGSPASNAGILAGDIIVKIDDKDATEMTLPDAVTKIRGKAGTEVKLTLVREGAKEPLEKTLKRAQIQVKSVTLTNKDQVGVIKISQFGDSTNEEWDQAVDKFKEGNYKYLVVDLRNNPGGRLQSAVHIISSFVDKSKIAVIQEDAHGNKDPLFTTEDGRLKDTKVVVLINKGSASASEIVSGALRDLRKVTLIGQTSFGKGTVQEVEELEAGAGLHLTTRKWLTPKEIWVHEKGLDPDIKVDNDPNDITKDLQLEKALQEVKRS